MSLDPHYHEVIPIDAWKRQAGVLLDPATAMELASTSMTNGIIAFLQDESNQSLVDSLKLIFQTHPDLNRDLAVRSTVFGQFGSMPFEPGAKMGLMVRFIEVGMQLVDWNRVIKELELDPQSEQEESSV